MITFDANTEAELARLNPLAVLKFRVWLWLVKLNLGLTVLITDGVRSASEQDAQHKADPRNPAHVAGKLNKHEAGEALDVNFLDNGVIVLRKASSSLAWARVVSLAKLCGIKWGGEFNGYPDRVHFYV